MPQAVDFAVSGVVDGKPMKGGQLGFVIPVTPLGMVKQFCALFSSLLPHGAKEVAASQAGM